MGRGVGCGAVVRNCWGTAPLQPGEDKAEDVTAVTTNPRGAIEKMRVRLFSEVHEEE